MSRDGYIDKGSKQLATSIPALILVRAGAGGGRTGSVRSINRIDELTNVWTRVGSRCEHGSFGGGCPSKRIAVGVGVDVGVRVGSRSVRSGNSE